ncbi:MAG: T9SS type A sorting domain-containing protein [Ignavibacteriae bacterium]|nr:T9SS type A sorting domain-containing protein [Ignavibacteriota bacterium]
MYASARELPKEFALHQNYPNPFNPVTVIRYQLPVQSHVTLKIYNLLGQEVRTLVDEVQEAGYKSVEWNAAGMASGVYFYRLRAGNFVDVKKLPLLK